MSMILYGAQGSCALVTLWAMMRTNVDFEFVSLDMAAGQQGDAAFLAINPHGRVPVLSVDGTAITEVNAILSYLAARYPAAGILPSNDPLLLGRTMELLCWFSTTVHVHIAQCFRGERFTDDAEVKESLKATGKQRLTAAFTELDGKIAQTPGPLNGDSFGPTDIFSIVAWRWAKRLELDMSLFPHWNEKAVTDMERPNVAATLKVETGGNPAPWAVKEKIA